MSPDTKKPSEEIDLLYFFSPLINIARLSFQLFVEYCRLILRNIGIFLTILIFFAAAGYLLRYILPKYYITNAVFISHYLPENVALLSVNEINTLAANTHNRKPLASLLKISEEAAGNIHAVDAQTLNSADFKYKFDTAAGAAFNVTLKLTDVRYLRETERGIASLLENNSYAINRKNARVKVLEILRDNLVEKERGLDSLKAKMTASILPNTHSQVVIMGQPIVPFELYEKQQEFVKQRKMIELELQAMQNIELVQPFPEPGEPNDPDTKKIFYRGIIAGLLAALALTPILSRKKAA